MAKWVSGEMDAVLSGTYEIQKHSSKVPCWKNGEQDFWYDNEQGFWHNDEQPQDLFEDHDLITCDMQASVLEQQQVPLQTYLEPEVPLQDIHHVHVDLEDLASQDFGEAIALGNGSDAKTDSGSDDVFELISILQWKPCLQVFTRFLLYHHDNPFSKATKGDYAELKRLLGTMARKRVVL